MVNVHLKRSTWYQISKVVDNGIIQTTDAMKVPAGVLVRNTTIFVGSYNSSESMTYVENAGIRPSEVKDMYEICSSTCNEAIV